MSTIAEKKQYILRADNFDEAVSRERQIRENEQEEFGDKVPQWESGYHITEDGRNLLIKEMDTAHLLATHYSFRQELDTSPITREIINRLCDKCGQAKFVLSKKRNPYCPRICWEEAGDV